MSIYDKAMEYFEADRIEAEKAAAETQKEIDAFNAETLTAFKKRFGHLLADLDEDGISYEAKMNHPPYRHQGGYVLFTAEDGANYKMNFDHSGRYQPRPAYPFGDWPDKEFVTALVQGLDESRLFIEHVKQAQETAC